MDAHPKPHMNVFKSSRKTRVFKSTLVTVAALLVTATGCAAVWCYLGAVVLSVMLAAAQVRPERPDL